MGNKVWTIAQKNKGSVKLEHETRPETKQTFSKLDSSRHDDETEPTHLPAPCLSAASRRLYISIRKHSGLIKSIIDVEEVVQHLYFIDYQNVWDSRNMPPRDRVELLLKCIERVYKGDKWEMFLEALIKSNYPYIVERITGKTTADHVDCNTILRMVYPDITERAYVPSLCDHFFTHKVLNARDLEKINAEEKRLGQSSACFVMLNLIPRRVNNWYEILKNVLRENDMKDIADKMEAHEKELRDEPKVESRTVTDSEHSDKERLRAIRQELRNVVHNLRSKRHGISEEEKRLLDDLMSILKEIETTGVASSSRASGASSHQDTHRLIPLENDSSSHDQHQTTTAPGTSAQSCSSNFAALKKINDAYKSISEDLAKNTEYLSNLTESYEGVCPSCLRKTKDNFDSAFYDESFLTSGEAVHL